MLSSCQAKKICKNTYFSQKNFTFFTTQKRNFSSPNLTSCGKKFSEINDYKIVSRFFKIINNQISPFTEESILNFLRDKQTLRSFLYEIDGGIKGNYLYEKFIHWLNFYSNSSSQALYAYFSETGSLNMLSGDFIRFCFSKNIFLDQNETLQSFSNHNLLSHEACKKELDSISKKNEINILGFGLDEGTYEKEIRQYLLSNNITERVNLYGFDPYAKKNPEIDYLTQGQIENGEAPFFDLITVRWVLHHVALQERWGDFINCINRCGPGGVVLVVEHGFLKKPSCFSKKEKKFYNLLNATFDIVANIGLRPYYFTSTYPNIGENFFIYYLEPEDFSAINQKLSIHTEQIIYDVGPSFPNQTIYCMHT